MKNLNLFLALAFALMAAAPVPAAGIRVSGRVESGGQKIAGATVRLAALAEDGRAFDMYWSPFELAEKARTLSGPDGRFELEVPAPGFYQVQVTAEGFLGRSSWTASFGDEVPIAEPIELLPARPVRLEALDPQGKRIAGARVRLLVDRGLLRGHDPWPLFGETAADGGILLQAPRAADSAAVVWAPGHAAMRVELPGAEETVAVRLAEGSPLAIEVLDPQRRPVADAVVVVPELAMAIGRTGADGKAVVRLGPGQENIGIASTLGRHQLLSIPPPGPKGERALRAEVTETPPLAGEVVALPSREPLAGAWVYWWTLPPVVTRSDREGRFELHARAGRHEEIYAELAGYRGASAPIEEPIPVTLGLEAAVLLEGRVKDAGGTPVRGARVRVSVEGEEIYETDRAAFATTGEEGRFRIGDAVAGEVLEVSASFDGLESGKVRVEPLEAGEKTRVELQLPDPAAWSAQVVDPAGRPIAGAEVFAAKASTERYERLELSDLPAGNEAEPMPSYKNIRPFGVSDAEGRLAAGGLNPGVYDLAIRAPGFASLLRREVHLAPPAAEEAAGPPEKIVLRPVAIAHGKVVGEDGEGIAGANILVDQSEPGPFGMRGLALDLPPVATSGEGGRFTFAAVEADRSFDLVAVKEGYVTARLIDVRLAGEGLPAEQAVGPAPAQPASLTLTLIRGFRIEGRVTSGGAPLPSVGVEVEPLEGSLGEAHFDLYYEHSDDEGRYLVDGIRPGRYFLRAGRLAGYQSWQSEIFEARSGEKKVLDVELEKASFITGRVLLPNGEPAAEVRVFLDPSRQQPSSDHPSGRTDRWGQYRIATAKPGPGWLRVESRIYKTQGRTVEIAAGVNQIDFTLEKGALALAGRVVDKDGEPIAAAEVSLLGSSMREARSAADGGVAFPDLEDGIYQLQIRAPGYFFRPQLIRLSEPLSGQLWRLDAAAGRVRGQVAGLAPAQSGDVRVFARQAAEAAEGPMGMFLAGGFSPLTDEDAPYRSEVDGEGRFAIEGLSAGKWVLIANYRPAGLTLVREVEVREAAGEIEQNFDFRHLGGPWVGNIRLSGEILPGLAYFLLHPAAGMLQSGQSADGRIELRAEPGSYMLGLAASGGVMKMLEIEIGAGPSEETIDLASPGGL